MELTGNTLALARTLTQVASWVRGARFVPGVAMARAGSVIVARVARLCEPNETLSRSGRRVLEPWRGLAVLVAVGACSPSIGAPYARVQRAEGASSNALVPSTTVATAPELVRDGLADDPRAIELSAEARELLEKEQRLAQQIEHTQGCAAGPIESPQTRAELGLLQQELALTARQRQLHERYLAARTQAWSPELEQRFEHERAALMSTWGDVSSSGLACSSSQGGVL